MRKDGETDRMMHEGQKVGKVMEERWKDRRVRSNKETQSCQLTLRFALIVLLYVVTCEDVRLLSQFEDPPLCRRYRRILVL